MLGLQLTLKDQEQVPELGQGLGQHPWMLAIGGGRGKVQRQLQGQSEGHVWMRLKGLGLVHEQVQELVHVLTEAGACHEKEQRQLQGQFEGHVWWRLKGLGQVRVLVQEQVHELSEASDGH